MTHYCSKECDRVRQPSVIVSQTVNFTIEGAGVTDYYGNTSGVWQANTTYNLNCPAVAEGEEKTATITMWNSNGKRILYYKLTRAESSDDGPGPW